MKHYKNILESEVIVPGAINRIIQYNTEWKNKDINSKIGFQNVKQPSNDLKGIELFGLIMAINYFEKV